MKVKAVPLVEAGRALRVGRSKMYELARSGGIPAIKIGGTWRVPVDALDDMLRGK